MMTLVVALIVAVEIEVELPTPECLLRRQLLLPFVGDFLGRFAGL